MHSVDYMQHECVCFATPISLWCHSHHEFDAHSSAYRHYFLSKVSFCQLNFQKEAEKSNMRILTVTLTDNDNVKQEKDSTDVVAVG